MIEALSPPSSDASTAPSADPRFREVLERPAESFFLGAEWFNACLNTWPGKDRYAVTRITRNGETSIALIGSGRRRSRLRWSSRMLALNELYDPVYDQVTMECNGLYGIDSGQFEEHFDELIAGLLQRSNWDELRIAGVMDTRAEAVRRVAARHGLHVEPYSTKQTYWVDLDDIRGAHGGDYLAALSSNTRQQLRRARRAAQNALGEVQLAAAATTDEALSWFDDIGPLHRTRWGSGPANTGFDNPRFMQFHRGLIRDGFDAGHVELLRISAGQTVLSYLYNFLLDGRVYFYLGGVNYDVDVKFKPGMVAHLLAIERHLASGSRVYDFLAGRNRYKESMSTHSASQEWLVLQRPRLRLHVERAVRTLRDRLRSDRTAAGADTTAD